MKTILIGTSNAAKVGEVYRFLGDLPVEWQTADEVVPGFEIEENADTFEENAVAKVEAFVQKTNMPVLSMDSGLEVPALDGWPGVHSRRLDGGHRRTDEELIAEFTRKIEPLPEQQRTFRFVCAAAFMIPGGKPVTARGELVGTLTLDLHADPSPGFPYRRFWWIPTHRAYFLDLTPEQQYVMNHNRMALNGLRPAIENYLAS